MIKLYKENKNGKIELSEEELKELIQEAYDEGYKSGYDSGKNVYYPAYPYTPQPVTPCPNGWDYKITGTC